VDVAEAAMWGLAGGAAAGLLGLSGAVVSANFRWPWRGRRHGIWPHVFVQVVGLAVGAAVAAAAHEQITGGWPALLMGASAPSVIRGALSRVEVVDRGPGGADGNSI
jgi:hypothetical protein